MTNTEREKVVTLLKNYQSYKYAVDNYVSESSYTLSVSKLDFAPRNGSYGSREPGVLTHSCEQDAADYRMYSRLVQMIEGALKTLSDVEYEIIHYKWMKGWTLKEIEVRRNYGIDSTKAIHRRALEKLAICFMFTEPAEILPVQNRNVPDATQEAFA
ncbi:hypothetical protein Elgi_07930 [Paenibacillus elgii]|uniref:hypothetical protein n=1 Tax=Paenibacillus elgii TaxID=189691 RepID=UPI002D7ADB01|nr:hypothetical protein Elgi_07930 [Paenibacillus elgii]